MPGGGGSQPVGTSAKRRLWLDLVLAILLLVAGVWQFVVPLSQEPFFADEAAMVAQSFYWRLYRSLAWDHPAWLCYPAFDHPPLPKYLFGLSLQWHQLRVPYDLHDWVVWIRGDFSPPERARLHACRLPIAIGSVIGVLAAYGCGRCLHGRLAGLLAAGLLLYHPLFATHARRAMSDALTESLVLLCLLSAMRLLKAVCRPRMSLKQFALTATATVFFGALAPLAKLNGIIAPGSVTAALALAALVAGLRAWHGWAQGRDLLAPLRQALVLGFTAVAIPIASFLLYACLNPTLLAQPDGGSFQDRRWAGLATWLRDGPDLLRQGPIQRALYLVQFRREVLRDGAVNFPEDRIDSLWERLWVGWYGGFGKYSPVAVREIVVGKGGSLVVRFRSHEAAAAIWSLLVLVSFVRLLTELTGELRRGILSPKHLLVCYAALATLMVVCFVPLDWDRYFLPMQPPAVLIGAYGLASLCSKFAKVYPSSQGSHLAGDAVEMA
jgi:4-amino-4-deoxy-L-arabinose transferase-like glycosyltransferase